MLEYLIKIYILKKYTSCGQIFFYVKSIWRLTDRNETSGGPDKRFLSNPRSISVRSVYRNYCQHNYKIFFLCCSFLQFQNSSLCVLIFNFYFHSYVR